MDITHINLAYGRAELPLDIPTANLLGVVYPQVFHETPDENQLIRRAMDNPTGKPPLHQIVKPGQKIAVITSDMTRPTPSARLLPYILDELRGAGIPDEDISIVIALGVHRPMTESEINESLSPEVCQRYRVINHDPNDTVRVGVTTRGTPVEIFRPVVEADVRICLGNIEFHYYAGFSGGAKAILPGCASRQSIVANHSWLVKPGADTGRLDDNPVRQDLEEAVATLGVDFILNVAVDGEHRIQGAFAGDLLAAHRQGCEMVTQRGSVKIPRLADIVVVGTGGYPKDINFFQAHKALETARHFVRQDGILILLAECGEGFGNEIMQKWLLEVEPEEAIRRIEEGFVFGGHKAAKVGLILRQAAIYLVSSLPDQTVAQIHFTPYATPQQALDAAFSQLGEHSQVLVLPQAGSMLPKLT
jgi:nickel-dependent lactate racemase